MRALVSARCVQRGTIARAAWRCPELQAACQQAAAAPQWHRRLHPAPPARGLSAAASRSADSDGDWASSNASTATGWLLDPLPSANSASSAAGSTPNSLSSSSSSLASDGGSSPQPYDAIMMLGGGLLPDGGLPEWVVRRLEGTRHLYMQQPPRLQKQQQQDYAPAAVAGAAGSTPGATPPAADWRQPEAGAAAAAAAQSGCPIVLLGAGTPHKPAVVDAAGFVLHESTAYAAYLVRRGVPAAHLLKEACSYDTVGNGYFSLLIHALPAGWRRIAVVTSEFHLPRTRATFDTVYGLAGRQLHGDPAWFALDYWPVSDAGIFAPEVLEARSEKEAAAVAAWRRNTAGLATLADLHAWLFATHLCYSVGRQHEFGREVPLDPRLAATY